MWCKVSVIFAIFVMMVSGMELNTINKPVVRSEMPTWPQIHNVAGSVRCFCNLPACVLTAYMCKSSDGGCFSDLYHHSSPQAVYRGRHGCLELLTDKNQKAWCNPKGNQYPMRRTNEHPKSLLHCCYHDMCNHVDDPQTKDLINDTILDSHHEVNRLEESHHVDTGYSSPDVWFKAATIAVPICGAVILFALIALAVRLLRSETHNHTNYKLGCTYAGGRVNKNNCEKHFETSQTLLRKEAMQNPIYLEDPRRHRAPIVLQSKEVCAKMNYFHGNEYNLLPPRPNQVPVHKCYENGCKNINVPQNSCPDVGFSEERSFLRKNVCDEK